MNEETRVRAAPGARPCCDPGGPLLAIAQGPITVGMLVSRAMARGDGSRGDLTQLVGDLIAGGLLIELDEG